MDKIYYYRGVNDANLHGPYTRGYVEEQLNKENPWKGKFFTLTPIETFEVPVTTTLIKVA